MESRHDPPSADRPFSLAVHDIFGKSQLSGWRLNLYEIIFESDTPLGKAFDIALIVIIFMSVGAVMMESVTEFRQAHYDLLRTVEWGFTILFTMEYVLRLICVGKPLRYAFSFFGLVDFLATIPTYLAFFIPGIQYLLIIRLLRVLRIFRVLKLAAYMSESTVLARAIRSSRRKIEIFIFTVLTAVFILGSIMYLVEGEEHGFTSIPKSIYWAIVTLTTVGYGDISPQTNLGQTIAAMIMIIGYGVIAVPTGIVTAEIARAEHDRKDAEKKAERSVAAGTRALICPRCYAGGHDDDAAYCKNCGAGL